ncbi:MAG: serine/threonine-protein kinase [Gemmatimonadales bacterium]
MTAARVARLQAALANRFVIDREVGGGGMGAVFQARDKNLGRQVAIKMLSADIAAQLGVSGFRREIKYTARLQHPHILPLLDTGHVDGQLYYVMPFVSGGSLRDTLRREGRMSLGSVARVVREVGSALDYAHSLRIVHCDIKPENILFSGGFAVVADFGIARSIDREPGVLGRREYASLGSPIYVSPEQATSERDLDERTDVYSFACVIYEMLTGRPPFEGDSVEELVAKRFTESPQPIHLVRDHVSACISRAVAKALERDPRDRFPAVGHLVRAVEHGLMKAPSGKQKEQQRASVGGVARWLWAMTGRTPIRLPGPVSTL